MPTSAITHTISLSNGGVAVLGVVAIMVLACLFLHSRKRNAIALGRLDEKIATYCDIRIRLATQILATYGASLPVETVLRMRRILRRHDDVGDDEAELRWERSWMPEMRKLMGILGVSVEGSEADTFHDVEHAVEANEEMLAEARRIRASIIARPSMIMFPLKRGDGDVASRSTSETSDGE